MASTPKIQINKSANKQFFVKVTASNNKTLVHSETFKTKQGALNNVEALKKMIPTARIVDNTKPPEK